MNAVTFASSHKKLFLVGFIAIFACAALVLTGCNNAGSNDKDIPLTVYSNTTQNFSTQYNGDYPMVTNETGYAVESITYKEDDSKITFGRVNGVDPEGYLNQVKQKVESGAYGSLSTVDGAVSDVEELKWDGNKAYEFTASLQSGDTNDTNSYRGMIFVAVETDGGVAYYEMYFTNACQSYVATECERIMTYFQPDAHYYDNQQSSESSSN